MTAAIQIDDDAALDALDEELKHSDDGRELRKLLRETAAGQKIMVLFAQARELVARGARVTTNDNAAPEAAPPAMRVEAHREDNFEIGAGECTVTLNGHVLWRATFALADSPARRLDDETPETAEEGARLFAETLRNAIAGKPVTS